MTKGFLAGMAAASMIMLTGLAGAAQDGPANAGGAPQAPPAATGGGAKSDSAKDKDAYFAALDKCEALKGVAEKQQCVDSVRKQYGQM